MSFASADGLYKIVSCDDSLIKVTTVTASVSVPVVYRTRLVMTYPRPQNVQTDPGTAIGLVAPYYPNSGYPQFGAGSAKCVSDSDFR